MFEQYCEKIIATIPNLPSPTVEGASEEGRPIPAYQFGNGPLNISLIGGCHADEPTGPIFLSRFVTYLDQLSEKHPMLDQCSWYVVPHANPDGDAVNQQWYYPTDSHYDIAKYLRHVARALPGQDIEYGFPIEGEVAELRVENRFIYEFWKSAGEPFHLHASLHSNAIGYGAWFLIDPNWIDRSSFIRKNCDKKTQELGYPLHDVDRKGEKGFYRIAEGFCTRPNHREMKEYFQSIEEPETAQKFHPTSMESIRSLGGDCLTLVPEIPMFLIPRQNIHLDWPDPELEEWKQKLEVWKVQLLNDRIKERELHRFAHEAGLRPVPVEDQMRLQWCLICSGIHQVNKDRHPH